MTAPTPAPVSMVCGNLVSALVARRQALSLTRANVATKLHTSEAHISKLERQCHSPTLPVLVRWGRALGLAVRLVEMGEKPRRGED